MPLRKAKPGSKGFGKNVKTEMAHGKSQNQAYSVSRRKTKGRKK
jgi:hypothetical protein